MQPTLRETPGTPQGALRLVQAMPTSSVKPDVLSPGRHCWGARVYGHTKYYQVSTTTAMDGSEYTPPPLNLSFPSRLCSHFRVGELFSEEHVQ